MPKDDDQLRLLSIFHYVLAGMACLFALIPALHLAFGLLLVFAPQCATAKGDLPPAVVGWIFVAFAAVGIAIGLAFAAVLAVAGRLLARRRGYMFCLVAACVECLFMPFGTALGVFTIIVLTRDSVKERFGLGRPMDANGMPPDKLGCP